MPWSQTSPMDQGIRFIADFQRQLFPFSELCGRFGISRKTGYKWIERYAAEGPQGLHNLSRRPRSCPHQTPSEIVVAFGA